MLIWSAPADAAPPRASASPLPPSRPAELDGPKSGEASKADVEPRGLSTAETACLDRLRALLVTFETQPATGVGSCRLERPLRLLKVGEVSLTGTTTGCAAAEALARWVTEAVAPQAEQGLGKAIKGVAIGASYECRGRNRVAGARLSEHAYGNAVDIMRFDFGGRSPVVVGSTPQGSPEARFVQAVRAQACAYFTTVLGPGSDPYHSDHLHLDVQARRGGHRLCR